ncbi:phosphopantetheine adenylyltransferase [Methanosphaera sp.]
MKANYKKIAIGGTFDKLHKGHEALIKTAFEMGDEILIGITSDEFANNKNHIIEPCKSRIRRLKKIINTYDKKYQIKEIYDSMGTADKDPELDAIVVSHETEQSAVYINTVRKETGLNPLDIIVIEWVFADDGVPISSTRIRKGEIDQKGKLL